MHPTPFEPFVIYGVSAKPFEWLKRYVNPHECDSGMLGGDTCPVCHEPRSISHTRIWDDYLQERVERWHMTRCKCCREA